MKHGYKSYEILPEFQVTAAAISVFLSYSRQDKDLLDSFRVHLAGLVKTGQITIWHDRDIEAGSEWEPVLQHQLNTAKIIILLISANFIASEYCYGNELTRAIERHDAGEAHVIPVILKPCVWNLPKIPFSKLNVLPNDALAVTKWPDPDEAFTVIVEHIAEIVDRLAIEQQVLSSPLLAEIADRLAIKLKQQVLSTRQPSPLPLRERKQKTSLGAPAPLLPTWEKGLGDEGLSMPSLESSPRLELIADRTSSENDRVQGATQQQPEIFVEKLDDQTILEMVKIPGGSFLMGSSPGQGNDNERPQHEVHVSEFWMGKYPVTQAQWRFVAVLPQEKMELDTNPLRFTRNNRPVEGVSWHEAVEFCQRLSRYTGNYYGLSSEMEWEYAYRAETLTNFYPELASFNENVKGITNVGSYPPNAFGLYDMHSNVLEWCADDWHDNYENALIDGSIWIDFQDSNTKILRGGFRFDQTKQYQSVRLKSLSTNRSGDVGFRVVGRAKTL